MILKNFLRAKAGVPKTLVKRRLRLHSLYFRQNSLTLTESSGEFSDLHSIFRLRVLRYTGEIIVYMHNFFNWQRDPMWPCMKRQIWRISCEENSRKSNRINPKNRTTWINVKVGSRNFQLQVLASTFNISFSSIVHSKTPSQLLSFPMSHAYVRFPDIPFQPHLTTIFVI